MTTPFIVAELSANHLGSLERALALVEAAATAGASAVKIQTFTPEQMVEPLTLIESGLWRGRTALGLYREAHTPREWHEPLFTLARELGLEVFSSVFHPADVDFLEALGCLRYKISSFELTDHALIRHAATTGKHLVISTGMASLSEIQAAVDVTRGAKSLTLLKCTSAYPAPVEDVNLLTMEHMRLHFECDWVGLSDHTLGIGVAVAAAALGADMIEKHLTLRRADGGPDADFSMEPEEFAQMVTACRQAEAAIGTVRYGSTEQEASSLQLRRASGGKRGERLET